MNRQLATRPTKTRHHSACPVYCKSPANGCYPCELIRERERNRTRYYAVSPDLCGER